MAFIRTNKRENPFSQIDRYIFEEDDKISWKAKGLMAYLLTRPDGWKVNQVDLVNRAKDSKTSVLSALQELRDAGYVNYYQIRGEVGKFGEWVYDVYERPEFNPTNSIKKGENEDIPNFPPKPDFPTTDKPTTDFPTTDYPTTENQRHSNKELINNNNTNNNNNNNNEIECVEPSNIKKSRVKKEFIPPTIEQIKEYIKEKGLNVNAIRFFDYFTEGNWIDAKGNKVKNWKQKILTWDNHSKPVNQYGGVKNDERRSSATTRNEEDQCASWKNGW